MWIERCKQFICNMLEIQYSKCKLWAKKMWTRTFAWAVFGRTTNIIFCSVCVNPPIKAWGVCICFACFKIVQWNIRLLFECFLFGRREKKKINRKKCVKWIIKRLLRMVCWWWKLHSDNCDAKEKMRKYEAMELNACEYLRSKCLRNENEFTHEFVENKLVQVLLLTHRFLEPFWFILPGNEYHINGNTGQNHQQSISCFNGWCNHWNNCYEQCS